MQQLAIGRDAAAWQDLQRAAEERQKRVTVK
jgi:hypothetical protein